MYNDLKYSKVKTLIQWNRIDNPTTRSNDAKFSISNFNLRNDSKEKYFTVCLKQRKINKSFNWLKSDTNKAKQLKILVIDDEADQASINTKDIEEDTSTINKLIKDIVNDKEFLAMNYISYTQLRMQMF